VIETLNGDYPISLLCDLLAVSRSSFYYQPAEANESGLREAVNQLAAQFPTHGLRRLAAQLRRASYELTLNRKRAQRVMVEEQIDCRVKRWAIQTADRARVLALSESGCRFSMAEAGQSAQNGHAERVIRTIKEKEVYLNDYRDLADARADRTLHR
jgi:hypothetical protein